MFFPPVSSTTTAYLAMNRVRATECPATLHVQYAATRPSTWELHMIASYHALHVVVLHIIMRAKVSGNKGNRGTGVPGVLIIET